MDEKIAEHLDAIERVASTINGDAALALMDAVGGIREALAELSPAEQRLIEIDEVNNTFDGISKAEVLSSGGSSRTVCE